MWRKQRCFVFVVIAFINKRKKVKLISRLIPEEIISKIKQHNDILAVIEQYVTLKRKGSSGHFGLCPFHQEKTPSFNVSSNKQMFYCYGCKKGGDVITFIMEIEHVSYPQALQLLAERVGIDIPTSDDKDWQRKKEKTKIQNEIMLASARWFYQQLMGNSGQKARDYLKFRNILPSTAKKFGLGYAPEEWDALTRHLQSLGFEEKDMLASGLVRKAKTGNLIDLFRGRLIFPIFNVLGKIIAFGGRILTEGFPKYINSPETEIYTKGNHLYALNFAKSSRSNNLVMAEGYLDVLAMHQAGITQAVATLGTSLTEKQAALLRKYTDKIIIAYDSDAAGQQAVWRSLELLSSKGFEIFVLMVPDGADPDDYIRNKGPERFKALLDAALPLLEYQLYCARKDNTSSGELDLLAYQDQACELLAKIDNNIVREYYAEKLSQEIKMSKYSVISELERRKNASGKAKQDNDLLRRELQERQKMEPHSTDIKNNSYIKEEIYLLALLAVYPHSWQELTEKPIANDFSEGLIRGFFEQALPLLEEQKYNTDSMFALATDLFVKGRDLKSVFAQVSMQLDDLLKQQPEKTVARQWFFKIRLEQLKKRKRQIEKELEHGTDSAKTELLRQELLLLSQQYLEHKQKYDDHN